MARARSDIPYRSQYASPALIGEILAGRVAVAEDPRWRETGAADSEEYVRWARSGCGMACLQMILEARGEQPVPALAELGRRAITHGAYEARPARGFGPLIYAGFVDFLAAELDLRARVAAPLELDDLVAAVAADEVVLASVSNEIRALPAQPTRRGGHLVLVFEASADGRRLRFHDPAGDGPHNTSGVWLEREVFERFYAGRGVAVELPRE
jgi:hypothetical protein